MDLATVRRLASPTARALIDALPPYRDDTALALATNLRETGLDAEIVAALLTQRRLRDKAADKFGEFAKSMLFTADGLEQATRLEIGAVHASRFRAAGVDRVWDLGCGIGADALALSAAGIAVTAVERDPVTAAVAAANLAHFPESQVRCADLTTVDLPGGPGTGVWLDPGRRDTARRTSGGQARRTIHLDELEPAWPVILDLAAGHRATGVKLAPAFRPAQLPQGASGQWISWSGSAVEATLWFGPLAGADRVSALVMGPGHSPALVTGAVDGPQVSREQPPLADLPSYLYEVDVAVRQAGLTDVLARLTDGVESAPGTGYLLADSRVEHPALRRYAVRDAHPYRAKAARAWLRSRGYASATIKKRGVQRDEATIRRDLGLPAQHGAGADALLVVTVLHRDTVILELTADPAAH